MSTGRMSSSAEAAPSTPDVILEGLRRLHREEERMARAARLLVAEEARDAVAGGDTAGGSPRASSASDRTSMPARPVGASARSRSPVLLRAVAPMVIRGSAAADARERIDLRLHVEGRLPEGQKANIIINIEPTQRRQR